MKAMLLCAGKGTRFLPVSEEIPKPLLPFLNVSLVSAHLRRLHQAGIREVAVNLHHLGDQIQRHLSHEASQLPKLAFFEEPRILGTAGALRNAASFLAGGDFLVANSDTAIAPDFSRLILRHRDSGRAATLLVTENRNPQRYTPLQAEGDRITAFGVDGPRPLLYTGICVLSPGLLARIPPGETALVEHLWRPLLHEGREEIGFVLHEEAFADLGRPGDFLRASLEALARAGPFPEGGGDFDDRLRVLVREAPRGFEAADSVLGTARVEPGASIRRSILFDGVSIGAGARLSDCLVARGRVPPGADHSKSLLWSAVGGDVVAWPLAGLDGDDHSVQPFSPRR